MNIVIFDKKVISGEKIDRTGCYFEMYQQHSKFYMGTNITNEEVDEILIYSARKEDDFVNAKVAKCSSVMISDIGITFYLYELKDADFNCGEVKRRVYGYAKKNNLLLENGNIINCYLIENENDYAYLIGNEKHRVYLTEKTKLENLQQNNDWDGIIDFFGNKEQIVNSKYWEHYWYLCKLCFALSQKIQRNESYYTDLDDYFKIISTRCLELSSDNIMIKSTMAYYYYNKYIRFKINSDFEIAKDIYTDFVNFSKEWYKEFYRYTNLFKEYLDNNAYLMDVREKKRQYELLRERYKKLIDSFSDLSEVQLKKYKKYYCKALYNYCVVQMEQFLDYWNKYVLLEIYEKNFWKQMLEKQKVECIQFVEKYLNEFIESSELNFPTIDNIQENPGFFHAKYRLAQLDQIKGIFQVMRGEKDKSINYFIKSNNIIDESFVIAREYKNNEKSRFNYPNYMRTTKAINYYFLADYNKMEKSYGIKLQDYQKYELAVLFILQNNEETARKLLLKISSNNKCYNKAKKLLVKINEDK